MSDVQQSYVGFFLICQGCPQYYNAFIGLLGLLNRKMLLNLQIKQLWMPWMDYHSMIYFQHQKINHPLKKSLLFIWRTCYQRLSRCPKCVWIFFFFWSKKLIWIILFLLECFLKFVRLRSLDYKTHSFWKVVFIGTWSICRELLNHLIDWPLDWLSLSLN